MKEQAAIENSFESYSAYANYVYQNRQDIEETLWAKKEAKNRAKNTEQIFSVNKDLAILYANTGDIDSSVNILNETLKIPNLKKEDKSSCHLRDNR